ncbi:hypothetical protein FCIRC_7979 [Fusarium circinatum]|uniref:Uncharacterized protein n=1 Tax=Fusarium circinatum TaxID=48490 RepID=A0A8H5TPM3_FUSCI|nr:hypothetical protein FCIRC_7979 [Fusarium circinatum]
MTRNQLAEHYGVGVEYKKEVPATHPSLLHLDLDFDKEIPKEYGIVITWRTPFSEAIWAMLDRSMELTQPVQVYGLVGAQEMCWNVLAMFTVALKAAQVSKGTNVKSMVILCGKFTQVTWLTSAIPKSIVCARPQKHDRDLL